MAIDMITLALAKGYTNKSLDGVGALKGAAAQIQSIEPISGGNRVTFLWESNSGQQYTSTMEVMDGADGKGIKSVMVDERDHLIITYTDDTTSDAGEIIVRSAVMSVRGLENAEGKKGDVVLGITDIVKIGDNLNYDNASNTLSGMSQQEVEDTVTDILDDSIEGYIEDALPDNLASQSDIDDLFNN